MSVSDRSQFVAIEEKILEYWNKNDCFKKSLEKNQSKPHYVFYDGPPFATGLPHHGHLLASTLKDIIPRYMTMKGYYVPRRFGWDCHGLPVEHEIDKQFGMPTREVVEKHGLAHYNEACRSIIMRYRTQWYKTVNRMGRWVDFDNDYKTMDIDFMESVWWVFSQLWDKGLIYQGNKVVPFSIALETPLSNFEAGSNYRVVQDPAITVHLTLSDESADLLIWTTTPWTLPSNMGVCAHPTETYCKVSAPGLVRPVILAQKLVSQFFKEEEISIIDSFSGQALAGKTYRPLFESSLSSQAPHFTVFCDDFVTMEDGTGLVHCAPAFGEDDHRVLTANGVKEIFCPVDNQGQFTKDMPHLQGMNVFDANTPIIKDLKNQQRVLKHQTIDHSYPHCPRSDSRLIYKVVPSWFVEVCALKDKMLANLEKTNWTPSHIKEKRFGNWLAGARDWAISRNRFWGTPIPLWKNDETGNIICMGSRTQLQELTGIELTDLHREHVDNLSFSVASEPGVYRRVDGVLDCWFESGSMPYAQNHYPFSQNKIESIFPADFIAEGLDQTRGWFYTLHVIASALFDSPAYKNVMVNGIILAADGKKMSKRLKNYTPPDELIDIHGADALRLYLIQSNLVKAEEQRFANDGIREMSRKVLLPWFNAFKFLATYAKIDQWTFTQRISHPDHVLDRWILSRLQSLKTTVEEAMRQYELYRVVPELFIFIDELTNTYIRLNRARFWQSDMNDDKQQAYSTLLDVCLEFSAIMAPFCPFLSEHIYKEILAFYPDQSLPESIHLTDYPTAQTNLIDQDLEKAVQLMSDVLVLGRQKRNDSGIKIKTPLPLITLINHDQKQLDTMRSLESIILKELNVKAVAYDNDDERFITYQTVPNAQVLGRQYGAQFKHIGKAIRELNHAEILDLMQRGFVEITGNTIDIKDIFIRCQPIDANLVNTNGNISILLSTELTPELIEEGQARELVSAIQKARKDQGLEVSDRIHLKLAASAQWQKCIAQFSDYIQAETLCQNIEFIDFVDEMQQLDLSGDEISYSMHKAPA